jgi:Tol biopolymer transport system component
MPRMGDVLEHESRTVDLEHGDFERLLGRRERKQRNRRIRAGALGVIVALATGIVLVRSLTSDPIPADPPVKPRPAPAASGSLAYVLDGDVYVAESDGSNAVRIADGLPAEDCYGFLGEYWAEGPMWSPDGRYLTYRRYTDCSSSEHPREVVISDPAGNVLATFPSGGWAIAWSTDSTRVAVWDVTFETIGVYGLDGARQTQLTMPPGWEPSGDNDPEWGPDGSSLMVDNVVVPLEGGTSRQLPWGAEAYSPDGSHVAYNEYRSLTVAQSDGSEPQEVFGDWTGSNTWSPTGDRIAFTTSGRGPASSSELRVFDVETGSVALVTEGERGSTLEVIGFSPRGDRILFSKTEDRGEGESSLWSINVNGSAARLVVEGTVSGEWLSTVIAGRAAAAGSISPPAPTSAASGTLAYILDGEVYVADPDGSNAVKIAKGISLDECASTDGFSFWAEGAMWSPDGRYLAFRRTPCPATEEDWGDVVIADEAGDVLAMFPADGWDIGWSPDSTRVAVWDTLFETVGVYGVDGARQAQITMPSGWTPSGDHDPAWLRDGTLAIDAVELPVDGGAAGSLDQARAAEWRDDYLVTVGQRADSPDGSHTAYVDGRSLIVEGSDGSGSVTLLTVEHGTSLSVIGFSPDDDRIFFSKDREGGRSLWSIGVDGSGARLVVAGTAQGDWLSPPT